MKPVLLTMLLAGPLMLTSMAQSNTDTPPRVAVANGTLEGTLEPSGIRSFKGIPFAAPPVGDLRWREPQPAARWQGVRPATAFGPRAMQRPIFGDMGFRSNGVSEDCLYLNVWTPAKTNREKLPVLVYYYGGGFMAGDGSEPRYDGEQMARRGIVAVTVNYRLNVFGFMAHPELTRESPHKASGNYGLLDQQAALKWVRENIAQFGGDPARITIAGESAGSMSVSALMVSPLSKDMIAGAIGESGSLMGTLPPVSLAEGEKAGVAFAGLVGASSLADLRAMPAEKLLAATANPAVPRFPIVVDGYFFPSNPVALYTAGKQAHVPLLVGWNSEEMNYRALMGQEQPGDPILSLVRNGWSNPGQAPRASLQRVEYRVVEGRLERRVFPYLDGARPGPPQVLCRGVKDAAVTFIQDGSEAQAFITSSDRPLPDAVRIVMTLDGVGRLEQLFLVASA